MKLSYSGSILMIDGHTIETPWIVEEAFELEGRVIVLMNTFSDQAVIKEVERARNGRNLYCYSAEAILLWKAEFPNGSNFQDYYYKISSRSPLIVYSFSSFSCEIDLTTGRILRKEFFK